MFASSRLGIRICKYTQKSRSLHCRILLPSVADSMEAIGSHFGRQTFIHIAPSMWIVCEHYESTVSKYTHTHTAKSRMYQNLSIVFYEQTFHSRTRHAATATDCGRCNCVQCFGSSILCVCRHIHMLHYVHSYTTQPGAPMLSKCPETLKGEYFIISNRGEHK